MKVGCMGAGMGSRVHGKCRLHGMGNKVRERVSAAVRCARGRGEQKHGSGQGDAR